MQEIASQRCEIDWHIDLLFFYGQVYNINNGYLSSNNISSTK